MHFGIFDPRRILSFDDGPNLPKSFGSMLTFDRSIALFTPDLAVVLRKVALLRRMGDFSAFCEAPFKMRKEADQRSAKRRVDAVQSCAADRPFWKPSNAAFSSAEETRARFERRNHPSFAKLSIDSAHSENLNSSSRLNLSSAVPQCDHAGGKSVSVSESARLRRGTFW